MTWQITRVSEVAFVRDIFGFFSDSQFRIVAKLYFNLENKEIKNYNTYVSICSFFL